jgi:hypothetical protein
VEKTETAPQEAVSVLVWGMRVFLVLVEEDAMQSAFDLPARVEARKHAADVAAAQYRNFSRITFTFSSARFAFA